MVEGEVGLLERRRIAVAGVAGRRSDPSYGVPHVTAADWGSLGFGEATAYAKDTCACWPTEW